MQISSIGSQQLQQVYSQLRNQNAAGATNAQQVSQQSKAVMDRDHDGDVDGPGPDHDGKGRVIDTRA